MILFANWPSFTKRHASRILRGWYKDKFGVSPDYSDLLGQLAKTPSERQQLLRQYWEPNDEEREENKKTPTVAHRALASLASRGFIRILVTTNFDRLMESALADAGVNATVLSSADQVHGALPLVHTQCCVFKVNGDYLDARIRNTEIELDQYPQEFDQLLDRILDDFGIVVCGWSGEWDGALRRAIYRAPSRRFSTYWAARGKLSDEAKGLIQHRDASVVSIDDADSFFRTLEQAVISIEEFAKPHPLSTEAAVGALKRYIPEPRHRIRLADLVGDAVDRVLELTSEEHFPVQNGPQITNETVTSRIRKYDSVCSTLLAMAAVGGAWAEDEHYMVWRDALERLGTQPASGGMALWLEIQRYPATLLLYALGVGAVAKERLRFVEYLFSSTLRSYDQSKTGASGALPPVCLLAELKSKSDAEVRGHGTAPCSIERLDSRYVAIAYGDGCSE